jgi:hypothetical protein
MKVRGGFAAIVTLLCVMLLVIVGGQPGQTNPAELAASADLTVATDDGHTHAEGEEHSHAEGAAHEHADGEDHAHDSGDPAHAHDGTDPAHAHDGTDPAHAHPEGGTEADPAHCHENCDPNTPPDPNHCHEHCEPTLPPHEHPVDPAPVYTQTQLDLLAATQQWISPRFDNVQAAIKAGYTSINDAGTGWEHYVNNEYLNSPQILTPSTIESLVYKVSGNTRTLVSGMYILPLGKTLDDTPAAFTTPQTPWHIHSNLCWKLNPIRVVGTTNTGQAGCPSDSIYFVTPPMLHVWLQEQPCGWFADLEQANGDCNAHPH